MKTILITGVSSGIGKETAAHFLKQGWNVIATMRRPEDAGDLADHENAFVTTLDVTDAISISDAVTSGVKRFGQIDVLLNNAGYGAYGPLEAFSMERIERVFDTNVIGLLAVTKKLIPHMRERGSGTIINVSSVGGEVAFPTGTLYHGTKFAVEGLSEALHYELAPLGIRLRIVQPGMVKTNFGGSGFDRAMDDDLPGYEETIAGTGRMFGTLADNPAEPEVIAQVIWNAANDSNDTLRYRAGSDAAVRLLDARKAQDDETFVAALKQRMLP
jgi:NAD(P)-dependent dehydrogenase (short-subunit alcohol dehydrogenase family)